MYTRSRDGHDLGHRIRRAVAAATDFRPPANPQDAVAWKTLLRDVKRAVVSVTNDAATSIALVQRQLRETQITLRRRLQYIRSLGSLHARKAAENARMRFQLEQNAVAHKDKASFQLLLKHVTVGAYVRRLRLRDVIKATTNDFATLVVALENHAKTNESSADPYSVVRADDADGGGLSGEGSCGSGGGGGNDMRAQGEMTAWREHAEQLSDDRVVTNRQRVQALGELVPSLRIAVEGLVAENGKLRTQAAAFFARNKELASVSRCKSLVICFILYCIFSCMKNSRLLLHHFHYYSDGCSGAGRRQRAANAPTGRRVRAAARVARSDAP